MKSIGFKLLFLFSWTALAHAQEIKYIDLCSVQQRTELRHPPDPPECDKCLRGGYGGESVGDGASDRRDPHALGVFLLRVTPTNLNAAEPFEVEFRVQNTGLAPLEIPVSPHLSDLQPEDDSATFAYLSLALVVAGESGHSISPLGGFVQLYGSHEHPESLIVLKPKESIRVRANVKLLTAPPQSGPDRFHGDFWLRNNVFRPHPGGESTETRNLYPNTTPTPAIEVYVTVPDPADPPTRPANSPSNRRH
jgi:hypothetical protein